MSARGRPAADLVCPSCLTALEIDDEALDCEKCGARYPVVAGIPDLRLDFDPYIDVDGDRDRARELAERARTTDFAGLVAHYWDTTRSTPASRAGRYLDYALRAKARGESLLGAPSIIAESPDAPLLDLGCGTGGLLLAARERGFTPWGVDIALRWLVIAKKRLDEAGAEANMVCASARRLPFAPQSFVIVTAADFLQQGPDAAELFPEAARVLAAGGEVRVTGASRFSLLADPHTGLHATGFLPDRWRERYVRYRTGGFDPNIRPRSPAECARIARRSFDRVEVHAPFFAETEIAALPSELRGRAALANRLRRIPGLAGLAARFGASFRLLCRRPRKARR